MMSKKFCDIFQPGEHASTFGGNPFVCGVALAVCQTLEKENILQNVQERGIQLRDGLSAIAAKYPNHISEVRGWGLINGLELKADIPLTALEIVKAAIDEGVLLVPAGPKVVRFVPPLIVTEAEVNLALQAVEKAIATLTK
jgi:acetylornithine aminotransferase